MTSIAIYDHESYRLRSYALEKLINSYTSFKVVYRDYSIESIKSYCIKSSPEILLISSSRVEESLRIAFRKLKDVKSQIKIILLTNTVSKSLLPNMKELGIRGYLVMCTRSANLAEGLNEVRNGKMYCCSEVSSVLLGMYTQTALEFSERERSIIKLLVADNSSKEIADKLCLSVHTVVSHRKSILKKFKVKSTAGIVRRAIESGYA